MEKDIKNIISDSLKINGGEYREIRIEENNSTRITYRGDSRENISINSGIGGCARVYSNGGWGFSSFNDIYQSKNKMAEAISLSKLNSSKSIDFEKNSVGKVLLPARSIKNPKNISLNEKINILEHYKDLIVNKKNINGCEISYGDLERKVIFSDTLGNEIEQSFIHVILRISANSTDGNEMLQSGFSIGSLGDFNIVENLDKEVNECVAKAQKLINAKIDQECLFIAKTLSKIR